MFSKRLPAKAGLSIVVALAWLAPIAAMAQATGAPGVQTLAAAEPRQCVVEANAKGLKGKPRKKFYAQCRKNQRAA